MTDQVTVCGMLGNIKTLLPLGYNSPTTKKRASHCEDMLILLMKGECSVIFSLSFISVAVKAGDRLQTATL